MGEPLPFGLIADEYDRRRPAPPEDLVDDLERLGGTTLDVGCGTGKAAVALIERGLSVLGLEPDERMAAVARSHGVPVEIGTFESWDDGGRRFDLLTFADSWHWVDPVGGVTRSAELLRPGGTVARFWNSYTVDPQVIETFDALYRRHAPEIVRVWEPGDHALIHRVVTADGEAFGQSGNFAPLQTHMYRSETVRTADDWVATVATTSDHLRLGDRLGPLLAELHAAIERLGGALRVHRSTFLALSRRT
jgi:SAM-dependent methyltransferase